MCSVLCFSTNLTFLLREPGVAGLPLRRRDVGVEKGAEGPTTSVADERLGVPFSSDPDLVTVGCNVLITPFLSGFAYFGSSLLFAQKSRVKDIGSTHKTIIASSLSVTLVGSSTSLNNDLPLNAVSMGPAFCVVFSDINPRTSISDSSSELRIIERAGLRFLEFGSFDGPGNATEGLCINQINKICKREQS